MFRKLLKPALWLRAKFQSIPQNQRAKLYGYLPTALTAAVSAGALTEGTAQKVYLLAGLVLGVGGFAMAKSNTPTIPPYRVVDTVDLGD